MRDGNTSLILWRQRRGRWEVRCYLSPILRSSWDCVVWKRRPGCDLLMVRERFRSREAAITRGMALRRGGWA